MGQAKKDRTTHYKLDIANSRLHETTLELIRRAEENKEAKERLGDKEDAKD